MATTLYGLKTCDTCRKALRALEAAGRSITVVDIRSDPGLGARLPNLARFARAQPVGAAAS